MTKLISHNFADRRALAEDLAGWICAILTSAIEARGRAVLAVSGGSTPCLLFDVLSRKDIAWDRVNITLVDERWVDAANPRSNGRLIKTHLAINNAAAANVTPLYNGMSNVEEALSDVAAAIQALPLPFDVVLLGMGADGHSASFFPGAENLAAAVDMVSGNVVCAIEAEAAGEPRLTLTLPVLLKARALALHIEGDDKRAVLARALQDGPANAMPVRHILCGANQLDIFWAP